MTHPAAIPENVRTDSAAKAWRRPSRIGPVLQAPWVSPSDVKPTVGGLYLAMYDDASTRQTNASLCHLPIDTLIFGDYALGHLHAKDAISDEDATIETGWFQDHHLTGLPIPREVVAYIPIDLALRSPSMAKMRERIRALLAEG